MRKIISELKNNFSILKNKKVLIGCSTGVDSMVLVDLCLKYLDKTQIGIIHVNHNKRVQSIEEENYIREFCSSKEIKNPQAPKIPVSCGCPQDSSPASHPCGRPAFR